MFRNNVYHNFSMQECSFPLSPRQRSSQCEIFCKCAELLNEEIEKKLQIFPQQYIQQQ